MLALFWTLCVLLQPLASAAQAAPELRFHHFHLEVADPAWAMRDSVARLSGAARTILPGHGPGMRVGGRYLIFDRRDGGGSTASETTGVPAHAAARYEEARTWADQYGFAVAPSDFSLLDLAPGMPSAWIPVLAFSTRNQPRVVENLRIQGVKPFQLSEETAKFRLPSGLVVEIIAETDRPDTHWCPMHPDVRAPAAAKCRLCGMDLVPIPEPAVGEYALDVEVNPIPGRPGASGLRLTVREPGGGKQVKRFLRVHERPFHLFIISRDLSYFDHVHPEQREDGTFVLKQDLPVDEYMLIADFLPAGGTPQMLHRAMVTPGGSLHTMGADMRANGREQVSEGLRVTLEADSVVALRRSRLRFVVREATSLEPVTDLEPYLGAPAHLLIVNMDLTSAIHGHPEEASSGPSVTLEPVLPLPGAYKLWVQFQRRGRVITVPFVIEAAPW
jgi:hypothetical protein